MRKIIRNVFFKKYFYKLILPVFCLLLFVLPVGVLAEGYRCCDKGTDKLNDYFTSQGFCQSQEKCGGVSGATCEGVPSQNTGCPTWVCCSIPNTFYILQMQCNDSCQGVSCVQGLVNCPTVPPSANICCVNGQGRSVPNCQSNSNNCTGGTCVDTEADCPAPSTQATICCVNGQGTSVTNCSSNCTGTCVATEADCIATPTQASTCCVSGVGTDKGTAANCSRTCSGTCITGTTCPAAATTPTTPTTPTGSAGLGVALPNPLGKLQIQEVIGNIIKVLMGASGGIALMFFIYGGFLWLTSAGNPETIKKGKDILLWSILGLALMFGSYVIVRYIMLGLTTGILK